jgi:hypothetical protein
MPSRSRVCAFYGRIIYTTALYSKILFYFLQRRTLMRCCEWICIYFFVIIYSLVQAYIYIYTYIVMYRALCFVLSNPRSGVPGNSLAGKGEALVGAAGRMRQRQTPCKHSMLMVGLTMRCVSRKVSILFTVSKPLRRKL